MFKMVISVTVTVQSRETIHTFKLLVKVYIGPNSLREEEWTE